MAFDATLRDRIHDALVGEKGITGKPLFGGYGVFYRGVMFAGVWRTSLIVKLWDGTDDALREPHTSGFDPMNVGKPMTGWVVVDPPGIATDAALREWLDRARVVIPETAKKKSAATKKKR